ncbi:MAG TPA: KTSC domain-containing protein [Bauldia sp.]|nr:KTSC domain-containing protein [Bauldia sp.]
MPSTVISDWSYDEPRNELTVAFVTGKVYVYSLVPASVAAAMRAAFSKGVYFNENIRDRYSYRQIRGDAPKPKKTPDQPSLLDRLKASRED